MKVAAAPHPSPFGRHLRFGEADSAPHTGVGFADRLGEGGASSGDVAEKGALPPLDGEGGARSAPGGVKASSAAIKRARQLRKTMTRQEARLWLKLRALRPQGFHFRRQAPMRGYVLDFVCHARRVVVECDGSQHADGPRAAADRRRDAVLVDEGYLTLRFWNGDVDHAIDDVVETIIARAIEHAPHPSPFGRHLRFGEADSAPHIGVGFADRLGEGGAQSCNDSEDGSLPPLGDGPSGRSPQGPRRHGESVARRATGGVKAP